MLYNTRSALAYNYGEVLLYKNFEWFFLYLSFAISEGKKHLLLFLAVFICVDNAKNTSQIIRIFAHKKNENK